MEFGAGSAAFILIVIPIALVLVGYGVRRRRQNLTQFLGEAVHRPGAISADPRRIGIRARLTLGAIAVLAVAVLEPQWGQDELDAHRKGRDLIIMLDLSLSMHVEDVAPNRLEHAKALIRNFVGQIKLDGGDRLALIGFAGRALLQCPMTLDYQYFLNRLEAAYVGAAQRDGSLIGDAVRQALQGFGEVDLEHTDIILFTDGDDHGSLPLEVARWAGLQNVPIHTVMIGAPFGDGRIPIETEDGERTYLEFNDALVRASAQPGLLVEIALLSNGVPITDDVGPKALRDLYDQHIATKPGRRSAEGIGVGAAHRFQWFVGLALLMLLAEMLIADRKAGMREAQA